MKKTLESERQKQEWLWIIGALIAFGVTYFLNWFFYEPYFSLFEDIFGSSQRLKIGYYICLGFIFIVTWGTFLKTFKKNTIDVRVVK